MKPRCLFGHCLASASCSSGSRTATHLGALTPLAVADVLQDLRGLSDVDRDYHIPPSFHFHPSKLKLQVDTGAGQHSSYMNMGNDD